MTLEEKETEFGRGLTYCLGLFLAHADRNMNFSGDSSKEDLYAEAWFNGASDHLYDLEIERVKDSKLRARLLKFQKKVLHWGHGFAAPRATFADRNWSIAEAKDLLYEIDRLELGVIVAKGHE